MTAPISQRHAFLSYMHENKTDVDELQEALEDAGIRVWRDTEDLWPGEVWQSKIRAAIKSDSLAFIACFSTAAAAREKSYQYEELTLAVEEYRLRRPNTSWLFTVRFDECPIPEFDLGGGRMLDATIQRVDLFGAGKTRQTLRLLRAVGSVINPPGMETVSTEAVRAVKEAEGTDRERSDAMKRLLRDPSADIELEDFMRAIGTAARDQFADENDFPATTTDPSWTAFAPVWIDQAQRYERGIQPALELVRLAGMYGLPQHNQAWQRFMGLFTSLIRRDSGIPALISLRGYPALILLYASALGSISRKNFAPLTGFAVEPSIRNPYQPTKQIPLVSFVNVGSVADSAEPVASALALADDGREIDDALIEGLVKRTIGGRHTPMSDHLHHLLRDLFRDEYPDADDYADAFDLAEVLLDALAVDAAQKSDYRGQGGFGRYTWRYRHDDNPIEKRILGDLERDQQGWRPVLDGLFGGSVTRATAALENIVEAAARRRQGQW